MLAQVIHFDGPRGADLLAAADRAGRDRLGPLMLAHPRMREELVGVVSLRQPDGAEMVVAIVHTEDGLRLLHDLVVTSELLPDEDIAQLPGPDRIEVWNVASMTGIFDSVATAMKVRS